MWEIKHIKTENGNHEVLIDLCCFVFLFCFQQLRTIAGSVNLIILFYFLNSVPPCHTTHKKYIFLPFSGRVINYETVLKPNL